MLVNSNRIDFREIRRQVQMWGDKAFTVFDGAMDEVAGEALQMLRKQSKATFKGNEYWKNWQRKALYKNHNRNRWYVIYGDKPTYRLGHLLEYGHVSKNGTNRVFPRVQGRAHIEPVYEWACDEAINRALERLAKFH